VAVASTASASTDASASARALDTTRVAPIPTSSYSATSIWDPPPGAPPGVCVRYCSEPLFVRIRPVSPATPAPSTRGAMARELADAIEHHATDVFACVDHDKDAFIPLARGDYAVIVGMPSLDADSASFQATAFTRTISVRAKSELVMVDGYAFGGSTHCPFARFVDAASDAASDTHVLLEWRASADRAGTDRVRFPGVPVRGGVVRLRVFEIEDDIAHLDRVVVERDGHALEAIDEGESRPLAHEDGVMVDVPNGRAIELAYRVPGVRDGAIDVEVVASGWYRPLTSRREGTR
jgi:hypothetical protein